MTTEDITNEIESLNKDIALGEKINKRFEHTGFKPFNLDKLNNKKKILEILLKNKNKIKIC